jgi:DNA-binding MarR family transcriptional regulator
MSQLDDRLAESRAMARMLMLAAQRAKADFAEAVEPFGIPLPLARALLVLAAPTPMRELAGQLACDPSYITGLADQLEAAGLVTRVPGKDRRIKLLQATEKGTELRERLATALAERSRLEQRLSPEQRDTLAELLTTMLGSPDSDAAVVRDQGEQPTTPNKKEEIA